MCIKRFKLSVRLTHLERRDGAGIFGAGKNCPWYGRRVRGPVFGARAQFFRPRTAPTTALKEKIPKRNQGAASAGPGRGGDGPVPSYLRTPAIAALCRGSPATPPRTPKIILGAAVALLVCAGFSPQAAEPAEKPGLRPGELVEAEPGTQLSFAMAVRAAREGLSVILVNHNSHLGGILSSGLGVWDTEYEGKRAPIYDGVRQSVFDHYRAGYGGVCYREALPGESGHTNGKFEAHVIESILTRLVANERKITVLRDFFPVAAHRNGARIESVELRSFTGAQTVAVKARIFADCTYEGDLLPLAGVRYRVGREARSEFNESHAGVIFKKPLDRPPTDQIARDVRERAGLNLRKFNNIQEILPQSTGAADKNVQAFNYRTFVLSRDPADRIPVSKPAGYDPSAFRRLDLRSVVGPIPNHKLVWNRPQLIGAQNDYIEGNWTVRHRVMDQFWAATLGMLYFLQNDPSLSQDQRAYWRPYGLSKDEFADNGHRPYEFYVREARRLVGRYIFTEQDTALAPGLDRAPVHDDAIAIAEWYLDSHSCTTRRVPGSLDEGKTMLAVETFPSQIPYRTLLPRGVDNLLVPVALSATHVAWGTIRLEPTWMEIGEAAGFAAALSIRNRVAPANLEADALVRELARRHLMLGFFE